MRTVWSTLRHGLAAGTLVALAALSTATSAHAGNVPQVLGQVACDPTTGEQLITWTYENGSGEVLDFDSGTATPALTAGTLVSTVVGMQPATGLATLATASGETIASADAVGSVSVSLVFARTVNLGTITAEGTVLLFGDCVVDTTVPIVDTTIPDTTVAPSTTVIAGSGGGRLPHAGNDDTLLYLAFALVGIGGALLVVRRRSIVGDSTHD
jgi:LPXTG-motif cell wall-anchored protein